MEPEKLRIGSVEYVGVNRQTIKLMLQFASDRKVSVAADVMAQDLAGESVLLNLQTEEYFGLDDVGTSIWQSLTENNSIQSAIDALLTEYDVEQEQLQHDVDTLIAELLAHGLVEVSPA